MKYKKRAIQVVKGHGFYNPLKLGAVSWEAMYRKEECKFRINITNYDVGIYVKEGPYIIDIVVFPFSEIDMLDEWLFLTLRE